MNRRDLHRAVIVGRIAPGSQPSVARIFAESDRSELPGIVGVRYRGLFVLEDLYVHLLETDGDPGSAIARVRSHPRFAEVSANLAPFITPYNPSTWRSPADAIARVFYQWDAPEEQDGG